MMPLTRCTLTGQDPCQGVISQLVGPFQDRDSYKGSWNR